ncbi:MAG: hypothetical protein JNG89_17365, partial [Planctomycetaceae bacterium]|nr:hypothetical protein [Planctomycetaceae bacterium]
ATQVADVNRLKRELLESHVAQEVNSQVQRAAFDRNKWWVIAVYVVCVVFLLMILIVGQGTNIVTIGLVSVVVLTMVYQGYQQFRMEPPLLYGPHECPRCHKIVYRRPCPYCESGE